jgi:hypothetical protein
MLSLDSRNGIVGFIVGGGLFALAMMTFLKKTKFGGAGPGASGLKGPQKPISQDDVGTAITAYSNAVADGAGAAVLNDLNTAFASDMGLRVYQDSGSGEIIATDLSGTEVASAQGPLAAPING